VGGGGLLSLPEDIARTIAMILRSGKDVDIQPGLSPLATALLAQGAQHQDHRRGGE